MNKQNIPSVITSLPLSQQVALWVIFRMGGSSDKAFSFFSSDFANKFQPFVQKYLSANPDDYGKYVGATLSGLLRNNILVKLSGDRDKLWTLSPDIKNNYEKYKNKLFEVKVYWS